jgi:hypothetical protein
MLHDKTAATTHLVNTSRVIHVTIRDWPLEIRRWLVSTLAVLKKEDIKNFKGLFKDNFYHI